MRKPFFYLLLFSEVLFYGSEVAAQQRTLNDSTGDFLKCVGIPSGPEAGQQNILNLKGLLEALLDVSTFISSELGGVPLLDLSAGLTVNTTASQQKGDIIGAWLQMKLTPLLSSVSQHFLTCLGNANLSCHNYQTVVQLLNQNVSGLNPEMQGWIFSSFMQPFLSSNSSAGCVLPNVTTVDWMTKNFGSFSVWGRMKDFMSLNLDFSGLDVLHLLSPEQKAELMLYPEMVGLDNSSLAVVLESLMGSLSSSGANVGSSSLWNPGYYTQSLNNPEDPFREVVNGFMTMFPPVGSFVHEMASFSPQPNLSTVSGAMLVQAMLNWTLAELAAPYKGNGSGGAVQPPPQPWFNPTDVNSWFTHVVTPILHQFLPGVIPPGLTAVFHNLFFMGNSENITQDICRVSLDDSCPSIHQVDQVVTVLQCAAATDLNLTEHTLSTLTTALMDNLNTLMNQLLNTNFSSPDSPFADLLNQIHAPQEGDLQNEMFIRLWFQLKLKTRLPYLTAPYLSCLSAKNFSLQTFQILVEELSNNIALIPEESRSMVLQNFTVSFLLQHNFPDFLVSTNSSDWILMNLGGFSQYATVETMYLLDPKFNALEALNVLTLDQLSQLMVKDFPQLPDKKLVINSVFRFMLTSPSMMQELPQLLLLITQASPPLSCSSSEQMFASLHEALPTVGPEAKALIWSSISKLTSTTPADCVNSSAVCVSMPVDESTVCVNISSSALQQQLETSHDQSQLCSFSITQYACAQLGNVSAADLATVLLCNLHGNNTVPTQTWNLFITKVPPLLGPALDQISNQPPQLGPSVVTLMDAIGQVTLRNSTDLQDEAFTQLWFGRRLRPLLPYASSSFLSCLLTHNISCSTYQSIVKVVSEEVAVMSEDAQISFLVFFIKPFLQHNAVCSAGLNSSAWLNLNFGMFSQFATISELQALNPSFSVVEVLSDLTVAQLAQLSSSSDYFGTPDKVTLLLNNIPNAEFGMFFSELSSVLMVDGVTLTPAVQEAVLQQVFERGSLTDPTTPDSEVQLWLGGRLQPFISSIQPSQLPEFFSIITQRDCTITQQGVALLNSAESSFSAEIQQDIYNQILLSLQGPQPLRCYSGQSYYSFLQSSFMNFQFPNLTTFLSLMPPGQSAELINSMSTAELSQYLMRPGSVDDETKLCEIFSIYNKTKEYLQNEPVPPPPLGEATLACVWPQALSASSQADVDGWFNVALLQYLPYLSFQQINSTISAASCLAFRNYVALMGQQDFSQSGISKEDVYQTLQSYLSTDSADSFPKCYDPSDPVLNSTAWFAQYIGVFITFLSVDDLENFGGAKLMPFTVNQENLQLLQRYNISSDTVVFYTDLLYAQDPNFNANLLPPQLLCAAPADGFLNLTTEETIQLTVSLQQKCQDVDPTVSAALAENLGSLSVEDLLKLGDLCTGVSLGQIMGSSSALFSSLSTISQVEGWSLSQSIAIVQSMLSGSAFKIDSVDALVELGNLVVGVPSSFFGSLSGLDLLRALGSASFLSDLITAPDITQETIVNQIISVSSSPDAVVQNVPDAMATQIPRTSLIFLSQSTASLLNRKQWLMEQAVLFFDTVADSVSDEDSISPQVLQGFTCTRVQTFTADKVKKLIKSCRPRKNNVVNLQESQLTCMYNYVKTDSVNVFTDYPADMLLYYNISQVQQSCQAYYSALGGADFTLFSPTLAFRKNVLINNALQCLGITGSSLSRGQVEVLGQMLCVMDSSFIQNSDPFVLEKLKLCKSLNAQQGGAIENLLLRGTTSYGAPASWNVTTLQNLAPLPLYLTSNFWQYFTQNEQVTFLRAFVPNLKKSFTSRPSINSMITEVGLKYKSRDISNLRFKRDTGCIVGEITQVQASDPAFPLGYDVNQFDACLSVQMLKDNLAALSDKASSSDYQKIILKKLYQAYPAGISDEVLQVLGPASRAASVSDISKWNITRIDTLSALMSSYDGTWSGDQVRAIVSRYLVGGLRTLGVYELNSLGGTNLCALNVSVLQAINPTDLQKAGALSVSNCSVQQKQVFFDLALKAFNDRMLSKSSRNSSTVSIDSYQLMQNYLSGANLSYILTLAISNVSMDLLTFITLNQDVINMLNVSQVRGLLGRNVPDLKTYENNTVIQQWISRQLQSDLNTLQIGLTGGILTSSPGSGSGGVALPWLHQLILLAVTIATLQLLH